MGICFSHSPSQLANLQLELYFLVEFFKKSLNGSTTCHNCLKEMDSQEVNVQVDT